MIKVGTCKFCGQQCQVDVPENATRAQIDDAVIDVCTCKNAVREAEQRKRLKFAYEYIDNIFEKYPDKSGFFKACIVIIHARIIDKVKILDGEWTYEIKVDSEKMIHINRSKNVKEENTF